ncbi:MAG TPA: hypothetical protein VMB23_05620, partial [Spirochaetia bacterium]|nr:hypothetical protein [Spirochaetia bacterium]
MIQHRYVAHFYQDSVTLMQFSRNWKAKGPFGEVSAVMATEANLTLLAESGLVDSGLAARPNDLLLVLSGASVTEADLDAAEAELRAPPRPQEGTAVLEAARSVGEAVSRDPGLNFALISVPGGYAAAEALKALSRGLHVMLFSDNVSVEQEVALKDEGLSRGLLVLGPDCGTAIVNGVPLGFANRVRRGPVGLVSASGTGLQEVSSLLDRWGTGVSQALGTGGRDLKDAVGGRTALACLNLLDRDPETRVIVLLGKAPGARTRVALEAAAAGLSKPVVFCFLGDEGSPTLAGAAHRAFALATGSSPSA